MDERTALEQNGHVLEDAQQQHLCSDKSNSHDHQHQHHHHHHHLKHLDAEAMAAHLNKQEAAKEARLLLYLALPTMVIQLGVVVPPFFIASYVGRTYGSVFLDSFSIANLTCNLFTLSLLQGIFSASDTLSPQAFGANNEREVGLLAMRGYVASILAMLPMNLVLLTCMNLLLRHLGVNAEVSDLAWRWYQINACGLPFYSLYQVTWKFLSAQSIMTPCVIAVVFSTMVILPCAVHFFGSEGFLGTALAMVTFQVCEVLILWAYIMWKKPHNPDTWPGLEAWREVFDWDRFYIFLRLGAGGILASSEWIYWETLSLIIGTIGVEEMSTHTIPTQVMGVSFMVPFGIGIALNIRMGYTLPLSVSRAKELVWGCWILCATLFGFLAAILYFRRHWIYALFTYEPAIVERAEEIWPHVTIYMYLLCMFAVNMGIATGLGMQWTLGIVTFVCLWVFGLPAAYYFAVVREGGLLAAWYCVWPPYIVINGILMSAFYTQDWDEIAKQIRLREGVEDDLSGEAENDDLEQKPLYGSITY